MGWFDTSHTPKEPIDEVIRSGPYAFRIYATRRESTAGKVVGTDFVIKLDRPGVYMNADEYAILRKLVSAIGVNQDGNPPYAPSFHSSYEEAGTGQDRFVNFTRKSKWDVTQLESLDELVNSQPPRGTLPDDKLENLRLILSPKQKINWKKEFGRIKELLGEIASKHVIHKVDKIEAGEQTGSNATSAPGPRAEAIKAQSPGIIPASLPEDPLVASIAQMLEDAARDNKLGTATDRQTIAALIATKVRTNPEIVDKKGGFTPS